MRAGFEDKVRIRGRELGFHAVGFSRAGLSPRAQAFRSWLDRGFAGEMAYLERDPESRADVTRRSPWARTVVSVSMRYGPDAADGPQPGISGLISLYARGADYHDVLKARLRELANFIRIEAGGRAEARVLVDTSAVLERDHASQGGVGWTGKNAMVISPEVGSYFFLGEIVTEVEAAPGVEMEDLCGSCARCIDACPTGAIIGPRIVDSRRCISYLTIELKGSIPEDLRAPMGEHLFGCDICQQVCPWNHRADAACEPALRPARCVEETTLEEAVGMDGSEFAARFRRTAISRAKRGGFVRNALIVAANRGECEALRAGRPVLDDADPVLRETAVWALSRGEGSERRLAKLRAEQETDPRARAAMLAAVEKS